MEGFGITDVAGLLESVACMSSFMAVKNLGAEGPHRLALGVVLELAEFLRAAAGFCDPRGPLDGGFARREFQDAEAAVELLGLRVGLVRYGAIGSDHQRRDIRVDTTTEHVDAGFLRVAYDRMCRFADGTHIFVGDVHCWSGEGDKVLGHCSAFRE